MQNYLFTECSNMEHSACNFLWHEVKIVGKSRGDALVCRVMCCPTGLRKTLPQDSNLLCTGLHCWAFETRSQSSCFFSSTKNPTPHHTMRVCSSKCCLWGYILFVSIDTEGKNNFTCQISFFWKCALVDFNPLSLFVPVYSSHPLSTCRLL